MESKIQLIEIISKMENTQLKNGGHGYSEYGNITIGDASRISSNSYCDENEPVAFTLIEVILSARAPYEKVVAPRMNKIRQIEVSKNNSINRLETNLISFDSYYELCDIDSTNKYNTLRNLIEAYKIMKLKNLTLSEYEVFNKWANQATIFGKEKDIIGSIPRIGIATYQHLRMNFGANTIKPDQRVCEVLEREFGYKKINQVNAIEIVEKISEITGYSALLLDQIMVKYGSSVYKLTEK